MSDADTGFGASLWVETETEGVFEKLALEFDKLNPPGMSRDIYESTHHASPDDYKEYIGGVFDGGEFNPTINFKPSATHIILSHFHKPKWRYQLHFKSGNYMEFAAVMSNFSPVTPRDEKMQLSFTLKVSGKPLWVDV